MKVLLMGGTGFVGSHIASALRTAGHELVIVSRSHGIDVNRLLSPADWHLLLTGVDVAINSVGIIAETHGQTFTNLHTRAPVALFEACVTAGVTRVIQISALGADEQAFVPYQQSKKVADDALRSLPVDWFVLRPSLIFGEGGKSTALFRRLASLPVIPLIGDGRQKVQPVHIDDLVATVMQCMLAGETGMTIDVVGPMAMDFSEWLQRLREQAGRARARTMSVPLGLMNMVASVASYLVPMMHPDNLRMLQQGSTADVQALTDFLGRPPRAVP